MEKKISMVHGSGGSATGELIESLFAKAFDNDILKQMEDSAVIPATGKIALTTDSFVVTPVEFPGGDIGRLSVCGTVNDLLSRGAEPKHLTCGFILQEGVSVELLRRTVQSMAETAREAGISIVAGDTKVVNGSGEFYINTTGVGYYGEAAAKETGAKAESDLSWGREISGAGARPGDAILVSGTLGDHHAAILSGRMQIDNHIQSDCAPLVEMVRKLLETDVKVHAMRDVTRGGLATVLKELAQAGGRTFMLEQKLLPVTDQVKDFCGLLGLDPLYMGNEGKLAVIVAKEDAKKALRLIRESRYGKDAAIVGYVEETPEERDSGKVLLRTPIGGLRSLEILMGEGLPRIC